MFSSSIGLDQLYTGCAGGSSRGRAFNNILLIPSQCVPHGVVVMK